MGAVAEVLKEMWDWFVGEWKRGFREHPVMCRFIAIWLPLAWLLIAVVAVIEKLK